MSIRCLPPSDQPSKQNRHGSWPPMQKRRNKDFTNALLPPSLGDFLLMPRATSISRNFAARSTRIKTAVIYT